MNPNTVYEQSFLPRMSVHILTLREYAKSTETITGTKIKPDVTLNNSNSNPRAKCTL